MTIFFTFFCFWGKLGHKFRFIQFYMQREKKANWSVRFFSPRYKVDTAKFQECLLVFGHSRRLLYFMSYLGFRRTVHPDYNSLNFFKAIPNTSVKDRKVVSVPFVKLFFKKTSKKLFLGAFSICYLATPQLTLGQYQRDSLTHAILTFPAPIPDKEKN